MYFALFNFIISVILSIADEMLNSKLIGVIYTLAVILPSLAVGVRRMHDVGKSGWFLLRPVYNLILAFTEGTSGDNQYGADPKNEAIVY